MSNELLNEQSEAWASVERAIWPDGPAHGSGSAVYSALKARLIADLKRWIEMYAMSASRWADVLTYFDLAEDATPSDVIARAQRWHDPDAVAAVINRHAQAATPDPLDAAVELGEAAVRLAWESRNDDMQRWFVDEVLRMRGLPSDRAVIDAARAALAQPATSEAAE